MSTCKVTDVHNVALFVILNAKWDLLKSYVLLGYSLAWQNQLFFLGTSTFKQLNQVYILKVSIRKKIIVYTVQISVY